MDEASTQENPGRDGLRSSTFCDMLSLTRIGVGNAPVRVQFLLDKCRTCGTIDMKKYSVSEAAEELEVDRRTLQRWVSRKKVPAPSAGIVNGRLVKFWTDTEIAVLRDYKKEHYAGKGLNRKTGKKAKQVN
jgi:excisionase family DNA binding protein